MPDIDYAFYSLIWDHEWKLTTKEPEAYVYVFLFPYMGSERYVEELEEKLKNELSIPLYGIIDVTGGWNRIYDPKTFYSLIWDPRTTSNLFFLRLTRAFYSLIWDHYYTQIMYTKKGVNLAFYSLIWDRGTRIFKERGAGADLSIPLYGIYSTP